MPPFRERPKGKFKAGMAGAAKMGAREREKKSSSNPAAEDLPEGSMKQYMAPIEYHTTLADKISGWKPIKFDSKTLGRKCDFTGMLSIETIDGDEADELLRKLGKSDTAESTSKKIKNKKTNGTDEGSAKAAQNQEAAVEYFENVAGKKQKGAKVRAHDGDECEVREAKSKGKATAKVQKGQDIAGKKRKDVEEAQTAGTNAGMAAACSSETRPKKKQKTQKERKEEKKLRMEKQKAKKAASAAAEVEDISGEGGEDTEEQDVDRDADYDDGYEYEEWGGIMLRKCITKALHAKGFKEPTSIQAAVLPAALSKRRDIFGAAETGSGKTLAFALPILQRILESGTFVAAHSGPQVRERLLSGLVLSPTRELALQVRDHIAAAARFTPIKCVAIVGGLSVHKQERLLLQRPHIVVGTPGRLWEQMRLGNEYLTSLHKLLCVVIDEADRMLESGHFEELENILRALPVVDPNSKRRKQIRQDNDEDSGDGMDDGEITSFMSSKGDGSESDHTQRHYRRQTLVFSATLIRDFQWRKKKAKDGKKSKKGQGKGNGSAGKKGAEDESRMDRDELRTHSIERLVDQLELPEEPLIIDLSPHGKVSEKIEQLRVECLALDKEIHIYRFLMKHFSAGAGKGSGAGGARVGEEDGGGRVIVFVNAIGEARRLWNLLSCLRIRTMLLHSGLQQRQRLKHLDAFKEHRDAVMICTDIAARGLDIPAVDVVLHYHVPKVPSVYVHRCGRTARGTVQEGRSILFVSPQEQFHLQKICDVIGSEVGVWADEGPFLEEARKRLSVARKLEAEMNKMGRGARDRSWMKQQAAELEIDVSDDEDGDERKHHAQSQRVATLQQQLDRLLDAHLLPKGVSPRFVTGSHYARAGLPEMLGFGSVAGSLKQGEDGGYGQRRRLKPGKKAKKAKKKK